MYLFVIQATPGPNAEVGDEAERQNIGGAYVNCWIDYRDYEGAEHLAIFHVKDRGWIPGEVVEAYEVEKQAENGEYADFISEAREIGYSVLFNCYPPDSEEDSALA